ncbi:hypothetical protein lerEdw1_002338, partial [Lerista edwardsae]
MQRDPFGIMLWLPRILGCCLIIVWTMASTGSKAIQPIMNSQGLVAAGGSLAEYRMSTFLYLPPNSVMEAVKIRRFAKQLQAASPMVKYLLVIKMVGAVGGKSDFVKYMPDALAPYVPPYELAFGSKFDTQDLNRKRWTSEQAAVFFDDLIRKDINFNSVAPLNPTLSKHSAYWSSLDFSLTPFLLSGFTCAVASSLSAERFQQLAKALKQKNAPLKEDQQIRDQQISQKQADSLGLLACELDSNYIKTSGKNFLKQLNQCHSFTQDQIPAIQALLISGKTSFGPPSKWTASHLDDLEGLITFFDQKILSEIPKDILIPWLKTFIQDTHLPREKLVGLMERLFRAYKRQGTSGCPADKTVTEDVVKGLLMPLDYTPEELYACLTPAVLQKYLDLISQQAFTTEQSMAVKEKLDEMYPGGYPESVLHRLRGFLHEMTPEDVMKWKITSVDILYSLLANQPPDIVASTIIKKYMNSEQFLDSFSVFAIGTRYICLLDAEQLSYIDEESIQYSVSLDPSRCSQTTKDRLYPKAKNAFFHQQSDRADYYNLIRPYLGGAPSEDLKILHSYEINMDIETFMNLRKNSLMKLTPSEVKGLLGVNVQDLKKNQNKTPIKEWIQLQNQEELDKIGVGLTSGNPGTQHLTTTNWTMAIIRSRTIQPIVTTQGLLAAGDSLAEYRMSVFLYVPPNEVLQAVKNQRFAQQLQAASPMVKYLLVIKMIGAVGGKSDFVKYMPDALVPYVPPYELAFGYKFDTQDLNRKPWFSEQAAVVFDDLIKKNVDFSSGFTCAVASYLNAERFRQLAKALKQKNVPLKEDQ